MSTETKNLPVFPEPAGWLTRFVNRSGLNCQVLCNHNSVGDYRDIDPGATSERVYSESQMHAYALEAIRASATSAPEQKPIMRQPFSYEQDSALCEANCNAESDAFFAARPALDSDANRRIFYAGHRRAWISYPAASAIAQPATPQPAEGS